MESNSLTTEPIDMDTPKVNKRKRFTPKKKAVRAYSDDIRVKVLEAVRTEPVIQVAKRFGISDPVIYSWMKDHGVPTMTGQHRKAKSKPAPKRTGVIPFDAIPDDPPRKPKPVAHYANGKEDPRIRLALAITALIHEILSR